MDGESSAEAVAAASDYSDILSDILAALTLQNEILSGLLFFLGVVAGMVFLKIFWDRFRRF